ncbi:Zn2+ transporter ZNT1 and related Cd2+/Zn2+ transporters (cation diffusion facilitator superfamily) [Handroanthus impetiginosus]|uniref:Zn2+ transporter ZNT1 and related Cd2+/Zn2+ transporters (Cation diffusion facilitator superfamily) n=1 Tax=Handroanthus impetiginosus TaxID=429701 RepID=A0A2G9FWG9_9LAMI|nr:Zn2+ transporter ZNT1 and related Cd2+/Zn2+ transporters (cation diffusion facilitator superfamily) [Handroanthus impetiginosus]
MADNHHRHHRPSRISLPPRAAVPTSATQTPRPSYPVFPYPPSTPIPTPSKHRLSISRPAAAATSTSSVSFLLLLLFSLRSLYSLLPFLRASPTSFSIFPFSFLVSLLSFVLTLIFSLFASAFSKDSFYQKSQRPIFSLTSLTQSQHKLLIAKSLLLAVVFLLRFQALRYCGTAAMILAELSGNVAARFMGEGKDRSFINRNSIGSSKVRGFIALFSGLLLLSISWDRIECFPLSHVNITSKGFSVFPSGNCLRIWPMLLPFLSGFLGCYERVLWNWGDIRELGQKRVHLITLFFTTIVLFIPAVVSMLVFEAEGDSISLSNLGWPLANTVVFGVLLSENCTDEKIAVSKDIQKEYFVTFVCTLVLELFYFPELSLWGLLICGLLLWISVRELNPIYINYPELGFESSESFYALVMKPIRHILSERKSRKIGLFLLINTAYMVVEFVAGFMSNSLGLISDACHMLFDCAALAIGLYASYISRLPANSQFNYGRGRFEVLSGYVNAVFLVLVGALITLESFERILDPQEISTSSLLAVSIGGLVVNIIGLIFFHEEHHHAHGGSGACSHSHSHTHEEGHSHSHSHHHDHHIHEHNDKCLSHGELCNDDHESHKGNDGKGENEIKQLQCNGHDHHHHHDQQEHHYQHVDSHDHNDHHVNINDNHHHHDVDQPNHHHHHVNHRDNHPSQYDHNHSETDRLLGKKEEKKHHDHHHHHHIDHNMQGIFLHVLADTMGSVGVVISTLLIDYKGWLVADPACSIFISALIVSSVIPLLRNSAEILLQRVPRSVEQNLKEALNDVRKLKGVFGIQNLHVWSFTNTDIVGTIHLHVSADADKSSIRKEVSHILHDAGIKDLAVQVECFNSN